VYSFRAGFSIHQHDDVVGVEGAESLPVRILLRINSFIFSFFLSIYRSSGASALRLSFFAAKNFSKHSTGLFTALFSS
jgi:hypothetical protein